MLRDTKTQNHFKPCTLTDVYTNEQEINNKQIYIRL